MDVLKYWRPSIDWSQFQQGSVSDQTWSHFCDVVQLCHAHGHWKEIAGEIRKTPPGRPIYGTESTYQRNKRRHEWKREIERAEGHMHRAGFLAAEKMAAMSYLLTPDDEGTPNWNLYGALRLAVRHHPHHETGRFKAAAFQSFDADSELQGEIKEIAVRWLRQAGYNDAVISNS